jgi:hypothetical protein
LSRQLGTAEREEEKGRRESGEARKDPEIKAEK